MFKYDKRMIQRSSEVYIILLRASSDLQIYVSQPREQSTSHDICVDFQQSSNLKL